VFLRCRLVCASWSSVRAAWPVLDARGFASPFRFARLFAACVPSQVYKFVADSYHAQMLTAFENLQHCTLTRVNMAHHENPLAFSHKLQSVRLDGCMCAKSSAPLAGLEATQLRFSRCLFFNIDSCCLSQNNGISELEFVDIDDTQACAVSTMRTVTSLRCSMEDLSAAGLAALFRLPLLRKLQLVRPDLRSDTFKIVPGNIVETLELVYDAMMDFFPEDVSRFVSQFQHLKRLGLLYHYMDGKHVNANAAMSFKEKAQAVKYRLRPELEIQVAFTRKI
jgi:hypothetical protein